MRRGWKARLSGGLPPRDTCPLAKNASVRVLTVSDPCDTTLLIRRVASRRAGLRSTYSSLSRYRQKTIGIRARSSGRRPLRKPPDGAPSRKRFPAHQWEREEYKKPVIPEDISRESNLRLSFSNVVVENPGTVFHKKRADLFLWGHLFQAVGRAATRAAVPGHTPAPQTPLRQGRGRGNLPSPETLTPCEGFGHSAPGISERCLSLPCGGTASPAIVPWHTARVSPGWRCSLKSPSFPRTLVGNPGGFFPLMVF